MHSGGSCPFQNFPLAKVIPCNVDCNGAQLIDQFHKNSSLKLQLLSVAHWQVNWMLPFSEGNLAWGNSYDHLSCTHATTVDSPVMSP